MGVDGEHHVRARIVCIRIVSPDPRPAARALGAVWIAVIETDDIRSPAPDQRTKVNLNNLAAFDLPRIADLRDVVVLARPTVFQAEISLVDGAAKLDHRIVPP